MICVDWEIWTAALVDDELKGKLIDGVARLAREGGVRLPFSDKYDVATGNEVDFRARPVAGGHLALVRVLCDDVKMALTLLCRWRSTSNRAAHRRSRQNRPRPSLRRLRIARPRAKRNVVVSRGATEHTSSL